MNGTFARRYGNPLRGPVACAAAAIIAAGGLAAPLAAPSFLSAAPATHYVASGESIQAAIDAAEPGDTVEVAAGTYNENVIIDKALTLRSEDGADVTVIDGGSGSSQIAILVAGSDSESTNVTDVTVEGFTVRTGESYAYNERGIVLYYANNCLIRNNRVMNNWRGISLEGNTWENIISDNYMTGNFEGVSLLSAGDDTIRDNTVVNGSRGIGLSHSSGVVCYRNTVEADDIGIGIFYGSSNYITENVVTGASLWGISIGPSGSSSHYTVGNTISGCWQGFYSEAVGQFVYYNNFLSNTIQVHLPYPYGSVYWDDFAGQGNYWSDYVTRYPDAGEVGETGVWDTPYVIFDDIYGNRDNYPLVNQWVAPPVTWTLSVDAEGQGTVEVDSEEATLPYSDSYEDSTQVTLTATAAGGSRFTGWTGDISSTESEITITMEQDTSVTAVFELESIDLVLQAGWNMISVPLVPDEPVVEAVFPDALAVYTWEADNDVYEQVHAGGTFTDIEPGRAYWVAMATSGTVTVTGTPATPETWTVHLYEGWNMLGGPYSATAISKNNLDDGGAGALQSEHMYWWDPGGHYVDEDELEQGKGYWMAATADCNLTMTAPQPPEPI